MRNDGRQPDELRPLTFERDFTVMALGSVLVSAGRTRVLCTASVDAEVPRWMRGSGKGWVTAEYSLLPGSSPERVDREAAKGKQSGRTQEIQRLIGRSLRAVTDMHKLGEVQITLDCDVLQADGGTRTASICGAYVALHDACTRLQQQARLKEHPLTEACAAVSVGVVGDRCLLDLDYSEDSTAEVDMNVVMTGSGRFIEVQGTAEGEPFDRAQLEQLIGLASQGVAQIVDAQRQILASAPTPAMIFVLASANPDKVAEIQAIWEEALPGVELAPRPADVPDVDETGATLEENARLKAHAIARASGLPAVADDTGLEVVALRGGPGVFTARYAGEDATYGQNVAKLLGAIAGVTDRRARFRTVAMVCWPDGRELVAEGEVDGTIALAPRGDAGFGYDPVFEPEGAAGATFAELGPEAKHQLSHRGRAFRALADQLRVRLASSPDAGKDDATI